MPVQWSILQGRLLPLILMTLLLNLVLVANPGFFAHDEWQKVDEIASYGFATFARLYSQIPSGVDFGHPVRPLGFLWQGIVALLMPGSSFLAHALDLLPHVLAVLTLFALTQRLFGRPYLALGASLLFAASPMTSYAVGWIGASMDRLYVLFGLLSLLNVVTASPEAKVSWWRIALLVLTATLAILSKETGAALPVAVFAYLLISGQTSGRIKAAILSPMLWASALPVIVFISMRLSALQMSIAGSGAAPYSIGSVNFLQNIWVYFYYPFSPGLGEAINHVFLNPVQIGLAALLHAILIAALLVAGRLKAVTVYLFAYYLPLLPVLAIANKGAHYLYGSAAVTAVAVAYVMAHFWPRHYVRLGLVILPAMLLLHAGGNQWQIYRIGQCMASAQLTLEASLLAMPASRRAEDLAVASDAGATTHVLHRLLTGRNMRLNGQPVKVRVGNDGEPARLHFDSACRVYGGGSGEASRSD